MMKYIIITIIFLTLASISIAAEYKYVYTPDFDPHTRYNPQLNDCDYFYGYGSCNVTRGECLERGNKWIDLGDACNRNSPPNVINLKDIILNEGERAIITAECIDQDPVNTTYSGWTDKKVTPANFNSAGIHDEQITCTDSFGRTSSGKMKITIRNVNRAPLFKSITHELNPQE